MNIRKITKYATGLIAAALLLQGCASEPTSLLEARRDYAAATSDGVTPQYAPTGLASAREQLSDAEKAYSGGKSGEAVSTEAEIAKKKIAIAVEQAKAVKAQEDIAKADAERQKLLTSRLERLAGRLADASDKANADRLAAEEARRRAEEAARLAAQKAADDAAAERARADELARRLADADAARRRLEDQLHAVPTPRGHLINIPDVNFGFDKSTLNDRGLQTVQQIVSFLRDYPDRQVLVEGHTDWVGTASYNQRLSERRANAVGAALIHYGVSTDRLTMLGYGKDYPIADNNSEAGRAQNRRAEIYISDDNQPVRPRHLPAKR